MALTPPPPRQCAPPAPRVSCFPAELSSLWGWGRGALPPGGCASPLPLCLVWPWMPLPSPGTGPVWGLSRGLQGLGSAEHLLCAQPPTGAGLSSTFEYWWITHRLSDFLNRVFPLVLKKNHHGEGITLSHTV